ncbi:MAG: DUF4173 domain-containing protein [Shimia sp.]|uniref:DUF4153 domain-containing protein n=1 Tax=Shimia sp. TaxID=1954381 RepID=UPI001B099C5E|nr:DUF4173 domain-containing protein [Shimia sp.]MBO6898076.1 DUF4173 domain-containing protein [Shimia sp.]
MSRQIEISGVPDCIRLDGWWLETSTADASARNKVQEQPKPRVSRLRDPKALGVLAFLVLLADWLFWRKTPGISVALFVMVLSVAILALRQKRTTWKEWCGALAFQLACNFPVIELLQPLSLLFSAAGLIGIAVWAFYGRLVEGRQMAWLMVRVSTVGAFLLPRSVIENVQSTQIKVGFKQHLKALVIPVVVGGVFLVLLATANPLLDQFLQRFTQFEFVSDIDVFRLVFWSACACVLWPYLHLSHCWVGEMPTHTKSMQVHAPWRAALINVSSVRNSLFLFNGLFLIQTFMDLGVLTGGVALPDGMTYAEYAHRGAYPLVATAILAGVFAITTRSMVQGDRILKKLMYLWLGQNLFLVVTAAFRLSLYVEVYTLTYLRLAAFIWMGLVFVGISLILFQIAHAKSVGWLVRGNLIALSATLYICCFINFAWVIADHNLTRKAPQHQIDTTYICALGDFAMPAIRAFETENDTTLCAGHDTSLRRQTRIQNWRDWGFRKWQLQVYLAG